MAIFLRLLTFLRPYKRGVWLSGGLALLAMGVTVAIPSLTGARSTPSRPTTATG